MKYKRPSASTYIADITDTIAACQLRVGKQWDGKPLPRMMAIDRALDYIDGAYKPNYPVPAIPLDVCLYSEVYEGCMYIDRMTTPYDPVIVYFYDSLYNDNGETEALLGFKPI